jgi:hypothetical protein
MPAAFDQDGIHFLYPENWALEHAEHEAGWTVAVESPETAFLTVSLREDRPSIEDLADAALATLREDYPNLDVESTAGSFAGQPSVGHDVRFFSLDLTNTCRIRSFRSGAGTVLVLSQVNDLEERNALVLEAICKSLTVDDE